MSKDFQLLSSTRMHTQNMSQSTQKYKLLASTSSITMRDNKTYMRTMESDLERSKLAVENISTFRNTEVQLKKRVDGIQNQLHCCMLKINSENKKQKVLTDLIALLKGDMCKLRATQKKDEETLSSTHEKKSKKIQYDMEQILQKHNQQIAKICLLKEQANGCRSERVVYSKLFKNLEKQIKHYEQIYKEELLKTEAIMLKRVKQASSFQQASNIMISTAQMYQPREQTERCRYSSTQKRSSGNLQAQLCQPMLMAKVSCCDNTNNLFITSCGAKDTVQNKNISRKNISANSGNQNFRNQTYRAPKRASESIFQFERQIKKLQVYGGCYSVDQLIQHYGSIEEENQDLLDSIEQLNNEIQYFKGQNQGIVKTRHHKEFATRIMRQSVFTGLFDNRKLREEEDNENQELKLEESVMQLLRTFGIDCSEEEKIADDALEKLDWRIDCLVEDQTMGERQNSGWEETLSSEVVVQGLLDRMEKFHDCEKILDKASFQNEYFKELNKGKRGGKTKKGEK